jgi:hypothetical protein
MGNFMAGVTGQIKLSERVALTADLQQSLAQTDYTLDGAAQLTVVSGVQRGFMEKYTMVLLV